MPPAYLAQKLSQSLLTMDGGVLNGQGPTTEENIESVDRAIPGESIS
jgi:hypothetical protein